MEENTVLREDVLAEAIKILEIEGIANTSLEMVAERVSCPTSDLKRFWPDREALLYDALRYLSQQVDAWRRQLLLDETLSAEQKLLARYAALTTCVSNQRYPGLPVYRRLHLLPGSSAPHSPAGGTAEAGFAGLHSRAADSAGGG
ncbi:putative transcriptional regulator [Klebsiella pneumoniae]|uniref:Putative transcriptional regulator n=1 Tax=Klebsiella pneumoniae TaxID=573 RepID=A0A3S4GPD4_KLEPN|nr:putative transcriptional regulator [Klebsiella pneumoniae]